MLRRQSVPTLDQRTDDDPDDADRNRVADRFDGRDPDTDRRPLPPPSERATAHPAPVPMSAPMITDRSASDATVTRQQLSVASALGALAGMALLVIGLLALLRGGLDGPIDEPVVNVLGFTHTPLLGAVDVVLGLLLLASAAAASRSALTFLGLAAVVAGAVAIAEPGELATRLAAERSFGWAWVIAGGIVAVAAWMLPVYERETRRVRHREASV